jgi:xanthine dehydrogenase YagS FAD-binding subunit
VRYARLVLGGVASIPWRVPDVEKYLTGKTLTAATLEEAAKQALNGAQPLAQNGYKVPLAQALIKRALTKLNA